MKIDIKVPSMGESISEVMIGQLLAPTGTVVKADGEILELETDKVNQVLYAPQGGTIEWGVKSGEKVKIGQSIGTLDTLSTVQEEKSVPPPTSSPTPWSAPPHSLPSVKTVEESKALLYEEPLRYTQETFLAGLNTAPQPVSSNVPATAISPLKTSSVSRETRRPMTRIRKIIAQRMVEAQQTMAMLTTFNEVDLTQVIQLREKYKESFAKKYGCKLGFMSFFVKAVVSALQNFPDLNSYLEGDAIVHREYYAIGVAVGTDKGVIVPVVRDCDHLSFADIERSIESYAKKARDGTLVAGDLQGGGFTITNGGTYGSLLSTPLLLPPQCGILGMHKIEKRPVVVGDEITIRSMMYLALSYDHRLIDGKEAVSFLVHIKNILEEPSRLLLEI